MTHYDFFVNNVLNIAPKWKFAAMDADGTWCLYKFEPEWEEDQGMWTIESKADYFLFAEHNVFKLDRDRISPTGSLINLDAYRYPAQRIESEPKSREKQNRYQTLEI